MKKIKIWIVDKYFRIKLAQQLKKISLEIFENSNFASKCCVIDLILYTNFEPFHFLALKLNLALELNAALALSRALTSQTFPSPSFKQMFGFIHDRPLWYMYLFQFNPSGPSTWNWTLSVFQKSHKI